MLRDKAELEFLSLKLPSIRRTREPDQWNSTSSEDPTIEKLDATVKTHPSTLDRKYMKRYVEFCTPPELKLPLARSRMLNRILGPNDEQD